MYKQICRNKLNPRKLRFSQMKLIVTCKWRTSANGIFFKWGTVKSWDGVCPKYAIWSCVARCCTFCWYKRGKQNENKKQKIWRAIMARKIDLLGPRSYQYQLSLHRWYKRIHYLPIWLLCPVAYTWTFQFNAVNTRWKKKAPSWFQYDSFLKSLPWLTII